jgi:ATP-binding cassette subfamily F protein 3
VLEEALRGYAGTLLFNSHDRSFINALATRVIDVRGGVLRAYSGNYDDYTRADSRGAHRRVSAPGSRRCPPRRRPRPARRRSAWPPGRA